MDKKFMHGGNVYDDSVTGTWLDFSANINPLGLARSVQKAIADHIGDVIHYPDPSGKDIKKALSVHYKVKPEHIILGNGAAELFYVYFHAFREKRVLLPVPSFSEYERAAAAGQAHIEYMYMQPDADFAVPWDVLREKCCTVDTILLGNPNNPTGTLCNAEDILRITEEAAMHGTDIIIDESFLDFLDDTPYSVIPYVTAYKNLYVIRSLTKAFALPGLRLGFGVVPTGAVPLLEQHKDVWNVNVLAQYAGIAALQDIDYQRQTKRYVQTEKEWLGRMLSCLPDISVFSHTVNFIFLRMGTSWGSSGELNSALRRQGMLIRDCQYYPGLTPQYIRLAVRTRHENEQLIRALRQYYRERQNM